MTLTEPAPETFAATSPPRLAGSLRSSRLGVGKMGGSSASISWAAGFQAAALPVRIPLQPTPPCSSPQHGAPAPAARIFPADKHRARVGNRDQVGGGAFIKWCGAGARASDGPSGTRCRAKSALRPTPIVCQGNPRIQVEIPTRQRRFI